MCVYIYIYINIYTWKRWTSSKKVRFSCNCWVVPDCRVKHSLPKSSHDKISSNFTGPVLNVHNRACVKSNRMLNPGVHTDHLLSWTGSLPLLQSNYSERCHHGNMVSRLFSDTCPEILGQLAWEMMSHLSSLSVGICLSEFLGDEKTHLRSMVGSILNTSGNQMLRTDHGQSTIYIYIYIYIHI